MTRAKTTVEAAMAEQSFVGMAPAELVALVATGLGALANEPLERQEVLLDLFERIAETAFTKARVEARKG